VRDTYLPFATGKLYGGKASTFYATAALRKILAYFNLGSNLTDWRNWLASNGPIMVRLDVDSTSDDASSPAGTSTPTTRTRRVGPRRRARRLHRQPLHRPQ
jgi:hypothetical protein